ncbi:GNAT family N-acetyltransferase [Spongisporangium articulatum]|uniref:GNAT family N-acetyltransferase n=1 Tax=Spongisporangium articulatum TaxID=3362603 RepID=A0ABW8ASF8_9ACTN
MLATVYDDPFAFAPLARDVLRRHPVACNVPASFLDEILNDRRRPADGERWVLVLDGREPVAVGMWTPPWNLFLSPTMAEVDAVARALAAALAALPLPGLTGDEPLALAFLEAWTETTGQPTEVTLRERLYEITEPVPPGRVPQAVGAMRRAGEPDLDLLVAWLAAFHAEAMPDEPWDDGEALTRTRLLTRRLFLWEDGASARCLLGLTHPAVGVCRVGPVYTPPEHRGRGYAGALVSAATNLALRDAATVALYADLANPTSGPLYERIGYRPIGDAIMARFG